MTSGFAGLTLTSASKIKSAVRVHWVKNSYIRGNIGRYNLYNINSTVFKSIPDMKHIRRHPNLSHLSSMKLRTYHFWKAPGIDFLQCLVHFITWKPSTFSGLPLHLTHNAALSKGTRWESLVQATGHFF